MLAFYLHLSPQEVDGMTLVDFEVLTQWIDAHEARVRSEVASV